MPQPDRIPMRKLTLLSLALPVLLAAPQQAPPGGGAQPPAPQRPKRPGVSTPGVRIPITKLKPEAVYPVPGAPAWRAVDREVWVWNEPKHTVSRLDPKSAAVLATITV